MDANRPQPPTPQRDCECSAHRASRPRAATHYLPPDARGNGIYLCGPCSRGEPTRRTLASEVA